MCSFGEEQYETRVAYEISVSKLERVEESGEITAASVIVEGEVSSESQSDTE